VSNGRKSGRGNRYRSGYLLSVEWFMRRDLWFQVEQRHRGALACAGCGRLAARRDLELHHIDYRGVVQRGGRWLACESHDDLTALHPRCHELLHRLIDRDRVLRYHRSRQAATAIALRRLRASIGGGSDA